MNNVLLIYFNLLIFSTATVNGNWGSPTSSQYHIQTDEGPERYFRYQTDNGQYRKEKRLEDGTVIGTEGWIDALGYMRLKDYIADNQGYRILKSKTVYVGKDRPIQDAIKLAKKTPATAGTLYNPDESSLPPKSIPAVNRPNSIPDNPLGFDHYKTPTVFIRPHSQPIGVYHSNVSPTKTPIHGHVASSTIKVPSNSIDLPFTSEDDISKPLAVYPPSSTPAPLNADFGGPIAIYQPGSSGLNHNRNPYRDGSTTPASIHIEGYSTTTLKPFVDSNDLTNSIEPVFNRNSYRFNNRPTTQHSYDYNNHIGNGYDKQLPLYDGIASTSKGFRYVLPRLYHEEDNTNPNEREGSFGYIDPFGIRRVIYYNASPRDGFRFRKNNRYVGFNATPYDPRPL